MTKQELRKVYRQKRLALSATDRLKLDDLLLIQFQRLVLNNEVEYLMSYWPLDMQGEMNTHLYTRYLEFTFPALKITFPVVDFSTLEMRAMQVNDDTEFIENKYAISEPEQGEEVAAEQLNLIFVPLLAFDTSGFRVGYGKGFYDRFLKKCSKKVIIVGFSYFEAVDKIEDTNEFDVPLNYCITPQKIYEF